MKRSSQAHRIVGLLTLAIGVLGGVPVAPAASALPTRYMVISSASAGAVTYDVPDFLIVSSVGGGAPTAQASVDSTRGSAGFASAPYPGDAVIGLPPTVRGLSGAPIPDYPLFVASRAPAVPKQEVSQPGYQLRSESTDTTTDAIAESGLASPATAGLSTARASAKVDDSSSKADSTVDVQAFGAQGVLSLGRVMARATAVVDAHGAITLSSSFAALQSTIAGTSVGITGQGITAAGSTVPLPDGSPLTSALKDAGITVQYLAPIKTKTSIISAGLRVTTRTTAPPQVPAVGGVPVTATYVLGQAVASVVAVPVAPPSSLPLQAGGSAPAAGQGGTGTPGTAGAPTAAVLEPGSGQPVVGGVPAAVGPATPPAVSAPTLETAAGSPGLRPVSLDGVFQVSSFYLVLVFAAFAALFGATVWRLLGVRAL